MSRAARGALFVGACWLACALPAAAQTCEPERSYAVCYVAHGRTLPDVAAAQAAVAAVENAPDREQAMRAAADALAAARVRVSGRQVHEDLRTVQGWAADDFRRQAEWFDANAAFDSATRTRVDTLREPWAGSDESYFRQLQGVLKNLDPEGDCFETTPAAAAARCDGPFHDALALAREARFGLEVVRSAGRFDRADATAHARAQDEAWDGYFYGTRFQYPWELALNRWANSSSRRILRDRHDNELGTRPVPTSRWMLGHPDIGLMLAPDAAAGDRLLPAVVFHWGGFMKWRGYRGDEVRGLWGAAITSTFADRESGDSHGLGITAFYRKFTLTVTKHGDDVAATFNLALGERLYGTSDEWRDSFKGAVDEPQ